MLGDRDAYATTVEQLLFTYAARTLATARTSSGIRLLVVSRQGGVGGRLLLERRSLRSPTCASGRKEWPANGCSGLSRLVRLRCLVGYAGAPAFPRKAQLSEVPNSLSEHETARGSTGLAHCDRCCTRSTVRKHRAERPVLPAHRCQCAVFHDRLQHERRHSVRRTPVAPSAAAAGADPADMPPRRDPESSGISFGEEFAAGEGIRTRFIRRAAVIHGESLYLVPAARACDDGYPVREAMFLFVVGPDGSIINGPATAASIKRQGIQGSFRSRSEGNAGTEEVPGVVPKGVAKVTLLYPRGHGFPASVTVAVVNNVYEAFVPYSTQKFEYPESPTKIVWRSRKGKVLKALPF